MLRQQLRARPQFRTSEAQRGHAAAHHDRLVAGVEDRLQALIDDDRGQAAPAQPLQQVDHLVDDLRGEALGRFVEQQQPGLAQQRAGDREHLRLATGEATAGRPGAFGQSRKHLQHVVQRPAPFAGAVQTLGDAQVLHHREAAEDALAIQHERDAGLRDRVGGPGSDVDAVQHDLAAEGPHRPRDRLEQRGLADAIAAEHADELARSDAQAHALQDVELRVAGRHLAQLKHDALPSGRRSARAGRP
jgi:hypothetical protein